MKCNFCKGDDFGTCYQPSKSKIKLLIQACKSCGLVQANYDTEIYEAINDLPYDENSQINKISCDADYSEIRVGKQQMAQKPFSVLAKYISYMDINNVLDMRSARGDFARAALEELDLAQIHCIEQDSYMSRGYKNDSRIILHSEKYRDFSADRKFDLVYSCHTLEHYRDPDSNLDFISNQLKEGGYLYLDVPNLGSLAVGEHFDDFFYDKHLFYFTLSHLRVWVESKGFEILECAEGASIEILARRKSSGEETIRSLDDAEFERVLHLIECYSQNLSKNRETCETISIEISKWAAKYDKVAVYGCGRLLDTFIEYGGLSLGSFDILIDNFLSKATSNLYGRDVLAESDIDGDWPDAVLVMTRNMTDSFKASLRAKFIGADVKHYSAF